MTEIPKERVSEYLGVTNILHPKPIKKTHTKVWLRCGWTFFKRTNKIKINPKSNEIWLL